MDHPAHVRLVDACMWVWARQAGNVAQLGRAVALCCAHHACAGGVPPVPLRTHAKGDSGHHAVQGTLRPVTLDLQGGTAHSGSAGAALRTHVCVRTCGRAGAPGPTPPRPGQASCTGRQAAEPAVAHPHAARGVETGVVGGRLHVLLLQVPRQVIARLAQPHVHDAALALALLQECHQILETGERQARREPGMTRQAGRRAAQGAGVRSAGGARPDSGK
jgi:hypothetical protein